MLERNTSCWRASLRNKGAKFSHAVEKYADVAAQADHAEAFADPVSGRFRCGRKKSGRYAVPAACGHEVIHGLQQPGMVELRRNAHGYGEIVVANPRHVDAGNGNDGFEILESANGFELDDNGDFLVALGEELCTGGTIHVVRDAGGDAATSHGAILEGTDNLLGLLAGFDAGHHDAARAEIEHTAQGRKIQIGHAHHGDDVASAAGSDHLFQQAKIEAAVLHVVDDEVEAAGIEHGPEAGGEEFQYKLAQEQVALLQPLAKAGHSASFAPRAAAFRRESLSRNSGLSSTCGFTIWPGGSPR